MSATITVRIVNGKPPVFKVEGHAGPSCSDLTKPIIDRIGALEDTKLTDEYYEPEAQQGQSQEQTVRSQ